MNAPGTFPPTQCDPLGRRGPGIGTISSSTVGVMAIDQSLNVTDHAEAKQRLIDAAGEVAPENASSLDAAADALLLRVSQFFGECIGGDTFCGLSIDETRDENGLLQSLRLVPCDMKGGEPVRRVGK